MTSNTLANVLYLSSLVAIVTAWVWTRRLVAATGAPAGSTQSRVGLYLYVLGAFLLLSGLLIDLTD